MDALNQDKSREQLYDLVWRWMAPLDQRGAATASNVLLVGANILKCQSTQNACEPELNDDLIRTRSYVRVQKSIKLVIQSDSNTKK